MAVNTRGNRAYPSLGEPGHTLESHSAFLRQVKEALEIHERRTGEKLDSFVRLRELVELGLARIRGAQIVAAATTSGGDDGDDDGGDSGGVTTVVETQLRGATWVRQGEAIETPVNDVVLYFPKAARIHGVTLVGLDATGSCEVDIKKTTLGSIGSGAGSSICGGSAPAISSGRSYNDETLTGWTVNISAGDVLTLQLVSVSTFEQVFAQLHIKET